MNLSMYVCVYPPPSELIVPLEMNYWFTRCLHRELSQEFNHLIPHSAVENFSCSPAPSVTLPVFQIPAIPAGRKCVSVWIQLRLLMTFASPPWNIAEVEHPVLCLLLLPEVLEQHLFRHLVDISNGDICLPIASSFVDPGKSLPANTP